MLLKRDGFPQEDELVLCTVTNIQPHSVFVTLDEYNGRTGLVHISEVAPGRIRNMRDFVKEGKKIVCKVLSVNREKGHIDLSLRRVNETQKRQKLNEIKEQQLAEKIVEHVAKQRGESVIQLYEKVADKLLSEYQSLFGAFVAVSQDAVSLEKFLDKKVANDLSGAIKARIKPPEVELSGDLFLTSYAPNGILLIKGALAACTKDAARIRYKGAGTYHVLVKSEDYKSAEKILKDVVDKIVKFAEKNKLFVEFKRHDE
ncbi:translation initiation factor IF-2 subunit alpha [Candidatus Woesearchaeota archaeon]|nr:translation initiation factor IF-2 subunit alpha [Candidatus Woesearchaeota archaeon]